MSPNARDQGNCLASLKSLHPTYESEISAAVTESDCNVFPSASTPFTNQHIDLKCLWNKKNIDEINVVKCEPWNSVKITFDLPTEAAQRLSELAELARRGDDNTLRQLGILSLQLQGGQVLRTFYNWI